MSNEQIAKKMEKVWTGLKRRDREIMAFGHTGIDHEASKSLAKLSWVELPATLRAEFVEDWKVGGAYRG